MQTPIRQKRPNFIVPYLWPSKCRPCTVPPGIDATHCPLSRFHCSFFTFIMLIRVKWHLCTGSFWFCGLPVMKYVAVLLAVCGSLVNGPYCLITTAVSADLGTHPSLQGNKMALATVTAIIDGTGSMGRLHENVWSFVLLCWQTTAMFWRFGGVVYGNW